jgi:hypothetical protein
MTADDRQTTDARTIYQQKHVLHVTAVWSHPSPYFVAVMLRSTITILLYRDIHFFLTTLSICQITYSRNINLYSKIKLIRIVGGWIQLGPLGTAATDRPIVPVPGDYDDGEIGGMIGRGNRSTQRKPAPVPLCPPQTPTCSARTRTRAAAVGSLRLTAWATARPWIYVNLMCKLITHG